MVWSGCRHLEVYTKTLPPTTLSTARHVQNTRYSTNGSTVTRQLFIVFFRFNHRDHWGQELPMTQDILLEIWQAGGKHSYRKDEQGLLGCRSTLTKPKIFMTLQWIEEILHHLG